jgi:hypothetical protein
MPAYTHRHIGIATVTARSICLVSFSAFRSSLIYYISLSASSAGLHGRGYAHYAEEYLQDGLSL